MGCIGSEFLILSPSEESQVLLGEFHLLGVGIALGPVFEQVLWVILIPRQIKIGWRVSEVPPNLDPLGAGISRTAWTSPSLFYTPGD